jgi:dynein light intermediate chain
LLTQELNRRLADRKARETGICAIREELFAQCFDELIRQITIGCTHRGLLLVRIRDEMRMTIQAYQNLYESALSYGMRKALQGENKQAEFNAKIQELTNDTNVLEKEVKNLEESIKKIVKDDEVAKYKQRIKTLRETLEAKLSGEEKKKKQEQERKEEEKKRKKEAKEKEKAAKQGGGGAAK